MTLNAFVGIFLVFQIAVYIGFCLLLNRLDRIEKKLAERDAVKDL